jgi:hypothetical protein
MDPEQEKAEAGRRRRESGAGPGVKYREGSYESYLENSPPGTMAKPVGPSGGEQARAYAEPQPAAPSNEYQPQEAVRRGPTGFIGFGQQQAANVEASERMAQQLGQAARETGNVGLLRSKEGQQALLEKALGKAGGVTPLDAALAGAAGGDYFAQLDAQYGPEAQARRAADMRAARQQAADAQAEMSRRGEPQRREQNRMNTAVYNEAARLREADKKRPFGELTVEQWARNNGMTLEQWIAGGKQPAF